MKVSVSWSTLLLAAGLVVAFGAPAPAAATTFAAVHVCMDFPLSRVGEGCVARSPQKIGPCGVEKQAGAVANVFRPGETIEVLLRETVNHPSHYRVAFNPDGDSFPDPVAIDDIDAEADYVLLDGIVDAEEANQTLEITFPNIECENCTLQLIQVMYDKQENGFGGRNAEGGNDDLYYSCADIALRGQPVAMTGATRTLVPGAAGLGLVMIAGVLAASRRRRGKAD